MGFFKDFFSLVSEQTIIGCRNFPLFYFKPQLSLTSNPQNLVKTFALNLHAFSTICVQQSRGGRESKQEAVDRGTQSLKGTHIEGGGQFRLIWNSARPVMRRKVTESIINPSIFCQKQQQCVQRLPLMLASSMPL